VSFVEAVEFVFHVFTHTLGIFFIDPFDVKVASAFELDQI